MLIVSIPHSSCAIPPDMAALLKDWAKPETVTRKLLSESDPHTEALFRILPAQYHIVANQHRFVVDPNRSRIKDGDSGVVRRFDFSGIPLYPDSFSLTEAQQEERLQNYWDPYHNQLSQALTNPNIRLLIDGHSMSGHGPRIGPDEGKSRPAICLGTGGDRQGNPLPHSPSFFNPESARTLKSRVHELVKIQFPDWCQQNPNLDPVTLNEPFDPGYILQGHLPVWPHPGPRGIMVEINRDLYFDEASLLLKPEGFEKCQKLILSLVQIALSLV